MTFVTQFFDLQAIKLFADRYRHDDVIGAAVTSWRHDVCARCYSVSVDLGLPGVDSFYAIVSKPTAEEAKKVKDETLKYRYKPYVADYKPYVTDCRQAGSVRFSN